jgi:hypothetical protein
VNPKAQARRGSSRITAGRDGPMVADLEASRNKSGGPITDFLSPGLGWC